MILLIKLLLINLLFTNIIDSSSEIPNCIRKMNHRLLCNTTYSNPYQKQSVSHSLFKDNNFDGESKEISVSQVIQSSEVLKSPRIKTMGRLTLSDKRDARFRQLKWHDSRESDAT